MNSQFCCVSSSTENGIALKPNHSTAVTYHHLGRDCGIADSCYGSTRRGLMSSRNEQLPLTTNCNHEITNLCMKVCQHSTKTTFNKVTNQHKETGKSCTAKDGSIEGCASPVRQTDGILTISQACPDVMEGSVFHSSQEQKPSIPGVINQEHCPSSCPSQKPTPSLISTCNEEEKRHRICSVNLCYSSADGIQGKPGNGMGRADFLSFKRNATTAADRDNYPEQQRKRHCSGDDVLGIIDDQVSSEVSNPKDACKTPLSQPHPDKRLYGKDTSLKVKRFGELSRLPEMTPSPSQVKAITSQTLTSANNTFGTFTSSVHVNQSYEIKKSLEIGNSPNRISANITSSGALTSDIAITSTNSKARSNKITPTNQPIIIDLTDETENKRTNSEVCRSGDQDPNDARLFERRKDIHEIINTAKPIQRDLLESDKAPLKSGVAFDHDSMPRLIGVLPSATANVLSSLAH